MRVDDSSSDKKDALGFEGTLDCDSMIIDMPPWLAMLSSCFIIECQKENKNEAQIFINSVCPYHSLLRNLNKIHKKTAHIVWNFDMSCMHSALRRMIFQMGSTHTRYW